MELSHTVALPATVDRTWSAILDPEVLRRCVPGCSSLEQIDDDAYEAIIAMKIGPLKAKFKGTVRLSNPMPPPNDPAQITLSGEANSAVGFAKGEAHVTITAMTSDEGDAGASLHYTASAKVGGKVAQLGSRVVDAVAQNMARQFFEAFVGELAPEESASPQGELTPKESASPQEELTPEESASPQGELTPEESASPQGEL
ncbi:MAG: carbon monoxide dehydrogenase subunit G, partial [Alphaproteobacteria bacterium]|nr:carbon monoxide dehydrogenase subunit G [Alphaproteobacteria bacterium]